jgi:hypothetical protein
MTASRGKASIGHPVTDEEPDFLDGLPTDNLVGAIVALCGEVWILRERLAALEAELADRRVVPPGAVERREPDESERAARQADLARFTERVLAELTRDRVPVARIDADVARHLSPRPTPASNARKDRR